MSTNDATLSGDDQKITKSPLGLLKLAEALGNISEACRVMGYSPKNYYRWKKMYEAGGELALQEVNSLGSRQGIPNLKNRVSDEIERAVLSLANEQPTYSNVRVSDELRKRGLFVSPAGVRGVWQRHNLETFNKRLDALKEQAANENLTLTEAQLSALEKPRVSDETEQAVLNLAIEQPAYSQSRVSTELKKRGLFVSPEQVRGLWKRHNLQTFRKRREALANKANKENLILTEAQLRALEKVCAEQEENFEIETADQPSRSISTMSSEGDDNILDLPIEALPPIVLLLPRIPNRLRALARLMQGKSCLYYALPKVCNSLCDFLAEAITQIREQDAAFGQRTFEVLSGKNTRVGDLVGSFLSDLAEAAPHCELFILDDFDYLVLDAETLQFFRSLAQKLSGQPKLIILGRFLIHDF